MCSNACKDCNCKNSRKRCKAPVLSTRCTIALSLMIPFIGIVCGVAGLSLVHAIMFICGFVEETAISWYLVGMLISAILFIVGLIVGNE